MKKSEDHIDKIFSESLGNQSFDIPTEFMDDLTARLDSLPPAKRKRDRFFFFFLNGLFLLIFTILSITQHNLVKQVNNDRLGDHVVNDSEATKQVIRIGSSLEKSIKKPAYHPLNGDDNLRKVGAEDTEFKHLDKTTSSTGNKNSPNLNLDEKSTGSNSSIKNATKLTTDSSHKKGKNIDSNSSKKKWSANGKTKPSDSLLTIVKDQEADFNLPPDTIIIRDTIVIFDTLMIRDTVVVTDTVLVLDTTRIKSLEDTNSWSLELQLFAGLNYGAERFSTRTTSNALYFLEEQAVLTPSFGFNVNATRNNWSVGSGMHFFQTGEKFAINSSSVTQNDTIGIVGFTFDTVVFNQQTQTLDSIFIPILDSVTLFDTITTSENWTNSYSWLSVPFNIGYRFDFGQWAIIPRAGITFNLGLRNSDGRYPNSVGTTIESVTSKLAVVNLDYLLQLEIRRSLRKAEIYISPNYRGNVTSMVPDFPIRRYQSLGLRLGVVIPL